MITVACLKGDTGEQAKVRERIQEAVSSLANNIPEVQRVAEQRAWVQSAGFWQHLDAARLITLQSVFAPLMRYRTTTPSHTVEINLPDNITQRSWIIYGPTGEGAFAESYREQVEALVRRLADQLPELAKLKQGEHRLREWWKAARTRFGIEAHLDQPMGQVASEVRWFWTGVQLRFGSGLATALPAHLAHSNVAAHLML